MARATRRCASCAPSSRPEPNYADARYLFGKILLARGDADEALGHLEAAARIAPDDANIHYQLGQAYQRLGRAELAHGGVRELPAAERQAARGRSERGCCSHVLVLALVLSRSGRRRAGAASRIARRFSRRRPRRRRPAATPRRCAAPTAGDKYQSVQAYLALARLEVRARQLQAALATLGKARVLAPNSEEVLDAFSQLALTVKQPMPGVIALQALTRMCPSVAAYHYRLGVGLMAIGDIPGRPTRSGKPIGSNRSGR